MVFYLLMKKNRGHFFHYIPLRKGNIFQCLVFLRRIGFFSTAIKLKLVFSNELRQVFRFLVLFMFFRICFEPFKIISRVHFQFYRIGISISILSHRNKDIMVSFAFFSDSQTISSPLISSNINYNKDRCVFIYFVSRFQ